MKTILITTIGAMLAGTAFTEEARDNVARQQQPAKAETISEKARNLWVKSKGYLSEDPVTFREGAQQTLTDLGKEIDAVAAKAGTVLPEYFQTRVQALRQQHEALAKKIAELNGEVIKTRLSGPRYAFDRSVASLENAIDQADDEAETLAKVNSPEKRDAK